MLVGTLILEVVVVIVGTLLFSWWWSQHFDARWKSWGWGALAFIGSQAARIPFLLAVTALFAPDDAASLDEDTIFWLNFVILVVTSGLFEETARYIVFRWLAKEDREWRDGIMFGAGHGGIEAILLIGGGVLMSLVLLLNGDTILAQLANTDPETAQTLGTQIDALRTTPWWHPLLGVWERLLAMIFHIAASLWVMRAVREEQWQWWGAAALLHMLFNGVALVALRYTTPVGAEFALTCFSLLTVMIIWSSRSLTTERLA